MTISNEDIKDWYNANAPFWDGEKNISAGQGVEITDEGVWGYDFNEQGVLVKQAGFGTDGKWIAGAGRVIADEDGLRTYDKSYDEEDSIEQINIGTDGKLTAGGGAVIMGEEGFRSNNDEFEINPDGTSYFGGTLKANDVSIDGTLEVDSSKGEGIKVINESGDVIIDGESNMFKIWFSGTVELEGAFYASSLGVWQTYSASVDFPEELEMIPLVIAMKGVETSSETSEDWSNYSVTQLRERRPSETDPDGNEVYSDIGVWMEVYNSSVFFENYYDHDVKVKFYVLKEAII